MTEFFFIGFRINSTRLTFVTVLFYLNFGSTAQSLDSCYVLLNQRKLAKAYDCTKEYLSNSTSSSALFRANHLMGRILYELDSLPSSLISYQTAEQVAESMDEQNLLPYALQGSSLVLIKLGILDKALNKLLRAYELFSHSEHIPDQAEILNSMANVSRQLQDYDKAQKYYAEALQLFVQTKNEQGISRIYNNVGNLFLELEQYDTATLLFKRNIAFHVNNQAKKSIALLNLGDRFLRSNNLDSALYYFSQSYQIKKEVNHSSGLALVCNHLAEVEIKLGYLPAARKYLKEGEQISKSVGLLKEYAENQRLFSILYQETGQLEEALVAFKQHKTLEDSILNKEKSRAITEMQVRFETEEKEKALVLAQERAQVQDEMVLLQRNTIIGLIIGIVLFITVGVLLYRLYKVNRNEKQSIRLRMREQHHRIENNVSVLASILSLAAQNATHEEARLLAVDGENRLNAVNLLHKQLYWEEDKVAVQLDTYILELTHYLSSVFLERDQDVLVIEVEQVRVEVNQAIPMCLILTELLTNCFKYGLTADNPKLNINLRRIRNNLKLLVSDNGEGIGDKKSYNESFGLKLVKTLVSQINGTLTMDTNDDGTRFELTIPLQILPS